MSEPGDRPLPDADSLTTDGLAAARTGRILLLACGALAREIIAIRGLNQWDYVDLACLPAKLHNTPEQIPDAVRGAVEKHRGDYDAIFVVYADCGTGGRLRAVCDQLGVEMVEGPHCYSFFEGNAAFAAHPDEIAAFYLTDFLARQFDTLIWKGLGLDRHPDLRDMIFGHYEKVVYLSQTDDPALLDRAQAAAKRLGLEFEHRPTGYGDLTGFLARAAGAHAAS